MSIEEEIGYLDASLRAEGSATEHRFWVQSIDDGVGRRIAIREFMGRDEPGTADLGRAAREHRIEAVLAMDIETDSVPGSTVTAVGTDVLARKQDLIDELETSGVKILTHPTWGELPVRVSGRQRITEQLSTLGRVSVSFSFVEAGDPTPYIFDPEQITYYVDSAGSAIDDAAEDQWSLLDQIEEFVQAAINKIEQANSALRQSRGRVAARMAVIDDLAGAIDDLDQNLEALKNTPGQIANQFRNLVRQIMQLISNNIPTTRGKPRPTQVALDICADLVAFGSDDPEEPEPAIETPQRAAHKETMASINNMVRSAAVVETSLVLTELPFESADEAAAARDTMTELGDTVAEGDYIHRDLFVALEDVRATLSAHLTSTAQDLPALTTYTPPETMPALVIAWELYGDITRADEIIDRNSIQRPNFVPGGVPLEVLSE
jgi:prophage DNA circulation protein